MNPRALVRPLEGSWEVILEAVLSSAGREAADRGSREKAKQERQRGSDDPRRRLSDLAAKVRELSDAYNTGLVSGGQSGSNRQTPKSKLPIDARVAFSFPRDVPKGAAAVRELVASGLLTIPADRPLRVVDVGAGLGAMTWGLARALAASQAHGRIEALLIDEDPDILETAEVLARRALAAENKNTIGLGDVDLILSTLVCCATQAGTLRDTAASKAKPKADLVLLGQVLSELDPQSNPETRIVDHAALLMQLLETRVADDGALVVIEPALRDRTRHLHAVRDRVLLETHESRTPAVVFAPCLHQAPCPMLALEREWCHEDLGDVDLPPWVVPLAREAGLRWQGLTFAYLVLRKDGRTLRAELPTESASTSPRGGNVRLRVISDLLRSKGKIELFACTEAGERSRLRRLERDLGVEDGVPFGDLERGDIVTLTSSAGDEAAHPIDDRGRIKPHVAIDVAGFGK